MEEKIDLKLRKLIRSILHEELNLQQEKSNFTHYLSYDICMHDSKIRSSLKKIIESYNGVFINESYYGFVLDRNQAVSLREQLEKLRKEISPCTNVNFFEKCPDCCNNVKKKNNEK